MHLFSSATDGQSFGRRSFFCIYLVVQPTDKLLEEEFFFLHLFSGATADRVLEEEFFLFEFI